MELIKSNLFYTNINHFNIDSCQIKNIKTIYIIYKYTVGDGVGLLVGTGVGLSVGAGVGESYICIQNKYFLFCLQC